MMLVIAPISAILMGVLLLLLGNGLLNTLLSLRSEIEGYSSSMIGIIMSGYFLGFFIGTYLALPLITRVGHIRAFAFCAALVSCSAITHILWINPYFWIFLRIVNGIALVILYTVVESWLNRQTPAESRGRVFAVYMVVNLGAIACAQQLLRIDSDLTFILFAVASIFVTLSLIPITWTRLQQPEVNQVGRIQIKKLYQFAPVAIWGALLSGLAMGAFWGLGPLYASRIGLSSNEVATFITLFILGGAFFQFPLGKYSDNHDRRLVLCIVTGVAAIVAVVIALNLGSVVIFYSLSFIYGGLAFAIYPVSVAHMVDHLEPDDMLSGGSGLLLLHGIGAMVGPLVAGQLMSWTPAILPLFWALNLLALSCLAYFYIRKGKSENPDEYAADFVPMIRTTPTALEMLPEQEDADNHNPVWGSCDQASNA